MLRSRVAWCRPVAIRNRDHGWPLDGEVSRTTGVIVQARGLAPTATPRWPGGCTTAYSPRYGLLRCNPKQGNAEALPAGEAAPVVVLGPGTWIRLRREPTIRIHDRRPPRFPPSFQGVRGHRSALTLLYLGAPVPSDRQSLPVVPPRNRSDDGGGDDGIPV